MNRLLIARAATGVGLLLPVASALAANGDITLASSPGSAGWTLPIQTLLLLSGFTFIPAVLLMMTGFTRIVIVLGLMRNALGTPTAPPNQVLVGLALFLTFFCDVASAQPDL